MNEVIMFVKPAADEFCIVLTFLKEGQIYIHQAYMYDNIQECIDGVKRILKTADKDYPIESVKFDSTLYRQEGSLLRRRIDDTTVFLYANKQTFEYRVINQSDYIKSFIFRKTKTVEYSQFMTMYEMYLPTDKYNIAVDILCDISRYYRARNREELSF